MKLLLRTLAVILLLGTIVFSQNKVEKSVVTKPKNRALKIISKPRATYPKSDTGTICVTGVVRLRVTFLDSGKIGDVNIVTELPYGLTQKAVEAAHKIKFEPEIREGKAVTVSKMLEYNFSIY